MRGFEPKGRAAPHFTSTVSFSTIRNRPTPIDETAIWKQILLATGHHP
tara:strand:+ start:343 stop:486 length:144 start_codon:yes stop_codon:yes gene_type:complete